MAQATSSASFGSVHSIIRVRSSRTSIFKRVRNSPGFGFRKNAWLSKPFTIAKRVGRSVESAPSSELQQLGCSLLQLLAVVLVN